MIGLRPFFDKVDIFGDILFAFLRINLLKRGLLQKEKKKKTKMLPFVPFTTAPFFRKEQKTFNRDASVESVPIPPNPFSPQTKTNTCANSVDPVETARNEPSHQDLRCFPCWF